MNIYKQTCYLICYQSLYVDKRYDREITAENSQLEKKTNSQYGCFESFPFRQKK